jgi:fumarate hydratase subunit alpha
VGIQLIDIEEAARGCLIQAGTTFREDQLRAYRRAIEAESEPNPRWVLTHILENAHIAAEKHLPLCDDTGIPHVIVKVGEECDLPPGWLTAVEKGVAQGLLDMPGRPMAVKGNARERVEQSAGLYEDASKLSLAPVVVQHTSGPNLTLSVLLLGGGPEIRAKTRRIFHRRSLDHVLEEAASWITGEIGSLGCTPIVVAMGIGRSQVEASALMLEAMNNGSLDEQNEFERKVTDAVNHSRVGPLGLGGGVTALGTFMKIGPTRASGVRVVSVRPCCCVEPRRATVVIQ